MIRHSIDAHTQPVPAVLEIPSKDHPYDATKDSILRRAKVSHKTNIILSPEALDESGRIAIVLFIII